LSRSTVASRQPETHRAMIDPKAIIGNFISPIFLKKQLDKIKLLI